MNLSIITVNLNNREGLQRTIDSVVGQTFRDFEWIVIDGGSTDGSRELIEQYADHFAYWVSEPDKGIYNAMNKGIKVAQGEYLQFLNSGDWIHDKDVLQDIFTKNDLYADIVYCDYEFYQNNELFHVERTPNNLYFSFLIKQWLGHSASFIRRKLFEKDIYDETYQIVSDWKFFIQQALLNRTFQHLSRIVSCQDNNGISVTNQAKVQQERQEVINSIVPQCIYNEITSISMIINDKKLMEFKRLKEKKTIYRKIFSLTIYIIHFFDKIKRK